MNLKDIGAAIESLKVSITQLLGRVTGLEAKAAAPALSAEEKAALTSGIAGLKTELMAQGEKVSNLSNSFTQALATNTSLQAEVTDLKAKLENKQQIATTAAAAAAGLAAAQTTPAVAGNSDANANGKSPIEVLQGKIAATDDPKLKVSLVRELNKLRGISFESREIKAAA